MKRTSLRRKTRASYLCGGRLALVVNLLLALTSFAASADLAQNADTRIAFMSNRSERNGEIFVMNPDGKRVRRLTRHPQYDAAPTWSPDGQKITFMSFRDEHRIAAGGIILGDIYVMNPDGTNPINLTNHPASDGRPTWSPDGKQIAFSSDRDKKDEADKNIEIYVMNSDGTNPINLTNHPAEDKRPSWSPDGTRIAFDSSRNVNREVYVMNADGTNPINLTQHPAWDGHASWGPALTLSISSNGKLAILWGKVKHAR